MGGPQIISVEMQDLSIWSKMFSSLVSLCVVFDKKLKLYNFDHTNAGAFGAGMVGMAMMVPNLNFAGGAPIGSQGAGTIGGGGLPTDGTIATAAFSLALVPLGLTAVSIFPPFARYNILNFAYIL